MVKNLLSARTLVGILVYLFSFTPVLNAQVHTKIIHGRRISTQNSPVVLVERRSGYSSFLCSGSLISPTVVLTAWHCVSTNPDNMAVAINGRRFSVRKVRTHPDVREDEEGFLYNDLALLFLKYPSSARRLSLLTSKPITKSVPLAIYGYGLDARNGLGILNKGVTQVDEVDQDFVVAFYNDRSKSNSCSGDSGGPAIATYYDENNVRHTGIVGVTSAGLTADCSLGDVTFYINTQSSSALDFITRLVRRVRFE